MTVYRAKVVFGGGVRGRGRFYIYTLSLGQAGETKQKKKKKTLAAKLYFGIAFKNFGQKGSAKTFPFAPN